MDKFFKIKLEESTKFEVDLLECNESQKSRILRQGKYIKNLVSIPLELLTD